MISIVSDTSTLYSISEGQEIGLSIVPLNITVDDQSYKDFEDITDHQLLKMIEENKVPRTSQPSLGEKIDIYNELLKKGEVIDITMASGLSGTYQTALLAKNACDDPGRVTVIDSMTLCGPHRALVDLALEMSAMGKSAAEITQQIENMKRHEISFLIPIDFEFLVRGGRLNGMAGVLGGLLKLMAVMKKGEEGRGLDKFAVCRTTRKVGHDITEEMKKEGIDNSYTFYISHAANELLALKMKEKISEEFPDATIHIYSLSPSFITQGGPGCVAIQAIKL